VLRVEDRVDVKDVFKQMMRDEVAPELRRLGFTGSGVNYTLPHPELYLLLHFQAEDADEPGSLMVTINISMMNKVEYEEGRQSFFPRRPTAASLFPLGRQFRIGALMGHVDKWWEISADQPTETTSSQLVNAVEEFALPELQRGSMLGPSLNRQEYDNS
jgi:hypothetical protein